MAGNEGPRALFAVKSNIQYLCILQELQKTGMEGSYVVNKVDRMDKTALIVMFYSCRP